MTLFPADATLPRPATAQAAPRSADDAALALEVTGLFDELRRPVFRYLLSCRVPAAECEEIVQEVFLALFRHLRAGKGRQNLRGWVFRVARNLALKHHHDARSTTSQLVRAEPGAAQVDPSPGPEEQLSVVQRRQRLLAVVAALPPRERECLHLRAEGLRYRDIAGALGISLGSVALLLSRALGRLARADGQ